MNNQRFGTAVGFAKLVDLRGSILIAELIIMTEVRDDVYLIERDRKAVVRIVSLRS